MRRGRTAAKKTTVSDSERLEIHEAIDELGQKRAARETGESYKSTGGMGLVVPCPLNILHMSPGSASQNLEKRKSFYTP